MKHKKTNNTNIFNYPAKKYSSWVFDETLRYQKQYGFGISTGEHATWNNEADAFKHAYMQAHLSLLFGNHFAKFVGDWHEKDGNTKMGQTSGEFNMDNWNNQQGRDIAREIIRENGVGAIVPSRKLNDIIAQKVIKRMNKGQLITRPSDDRKFQQGQPTGFGASITQETNQQPIIFTPEQIGKMSREEFIKNEPVIMDQLKRGQIGTGVFNRKYGDFTNPEVDGKIIFTREDIGKMSTKEYSKYEKAINYQLKTVGIPHKNEVSKDVQTYEKEKSQRNSTFSSSENGRWVTINGNHVFIEND